MITDPLVFVSRPKINFPSDIEFYDLFEAQHSNASAKLAFLVNENRLLTLRKDIFGHNMPWLILNQKLMVIPSGMKLPMNHFMNEYIIEAVRGLTSGGIISHLFDFHNELIYGKEVPVIKVPKVLSIEDLSFGFVIWFIACGVSVTVFLAEIMMWPCVKRQMIKKMKFLKVHPISQETDFIPTMIQPTTLECFKIKNPATNQQLKNISTELGVSQSQKAISAIQIPSNRKDLHILRKETDVDQCDLMSIDGELEIL